MMDQAKTSARRYVDVMESRKLIDGIWEFVPSVFSSINITNCYGIRYFNPCVDSSRTAMTSDDRLHSSLKSLFFNKYPSIKPVASFDNYKCITLYNELIHRIEDICFSLGWDFDRGSLDEWLIQITVEDLLSDIDSNLMKKIISTINFHEEPNNIEVDLFKRNLNFSLRTMLGGKDFNMYYPYLNYYIFHSLVMKLYEYKLKEIEENNDLIYHKDSPVFMDIPEYIIVSRDLSFDIYEVN